MESTGEVTTLLGDVVEALEDADHDEMAVAEQLEAYGKAERARGVMLAYQATHEQVAAADAMDDADAEADGWPARFRAAWRTLRGRESDRGPRLPSSSPALAIDAGETGDSLEEITDDLSDHLADARGDDAGDLRMFQ